MGRSNVVVCLFLALALVFCATSGLCVSPEPTHKETKDLMSLVRDASDLIQKKGEGAFSEFRQKGSKWLHGNTYIFVVDPKGTVYVNPTRPELEGKNKIDLKDLVGRFFIQSFITETTAYAFKNEGWTHYVWFRPGQDLAEWKTSFVKLTKAPSGKTYIVGSGIYNMKMDRVFAVDVVDEAADLVKRQGKSAFKQLKDPLGDFNYLSTYVFVIDGKGNDLVNPAFPGFEGQNVLTLKDAAAKYFIQDMMKALDTRETVWVEYMWPKPRQAMASKKSSYVRKVKTGDDTFYVGSGIYLD